MSARIARGRGYLKVAHDDQGSRCFCCESAVDVRFFLIASPQIGDRFFLRLCQACMDVLAEASAALGTTQPGALR